VGVYKSQDAGQSWQPAWEGLGLAAGQMVRVSALRADPIEPEVLYVAIEHLVGSTQVHASAAGLFVTADAGASWQAMAGPVFPAAGQASNMLLVPGRPLFAQAVTVEGLQAYAPDVPSILVTLDSDEAKIRALAARELGLAGTLGVWRELLSALDDPDPVVRMAAATALGRIDDPEAVPALLFAVEHPSEPVRLGAARALGMMGVGSAVGPLGTMLLEGQGPELAIAAEALGRIGGEAATNALLTALADEQPTPRWHMAMAALEKMGEPAVAPLVAALGSQDAAARRSAAQALGWVGSPSATKALVGALEDDTDEGVRSQAAWALGEIGDAGAEKALVQAQRRDPSIVVQAEAQWAVSRLPHQAVSRGIGSTRWASTLSRLQPMRWLVLVLTLAGAAWLMTGRETHVAVSQRLRIRHR
jgi:HEAT repeat protein